MAASLTPVDTLVLAIHGIGQTLSSANIASVRKQAPRLLPFPRPLVWVGQGACCREPRAGARSGACGQRRSDGVHTPGPPNPCRTRPRLGASCGRWRGTNRPTRSEHPTATRCRAGRRGGLRCFRCNGGACWISRRMASRVESCRLASPAFARQCGLRVCVGGGWVGCLGEGEGTCEEGRKGKKRPDCMYQARKSELVATTREPEHPRCFLISGAPCHGGGGAAVHDSQLPGPNGLRPGAVVERPGGAFPSAKPDFFGALP